LSTSADVNEHRKNVQATCPRRYNKRGTEDGRTLMLDRFPVMPFLSGVSAHVVKLIR
jgi:hypothetical protein